jgi:hypothetical protein
MSGGVYNYAYRHIDDVVDEIQASGCCYAASPAMRKAFCEHLRKVALALRAIEWNDSGDGDASEELFIRDVLGPHATVLDSLREHLHAGVIRVLVTSALEETAKDAIAALSVRNT